MEWGANTDLVNESQAALDQMRETGKKGVSTVELQRSAKYAKSATRVAVAKVAREEGYKPTRKLPKSIAAAFDDSVPQSRWDPEAYARVGGQAAAAPAQARQEEEEAQGGPD